MFEIVLLFAARREAANGSGLVSFAVGERYSWKIHLPDLYGSRH